MMPVAAAELSVTPVDTHADSRDDQELIAAANRGDAAAFEVLYFRYRAWVVSLACRFTRDEDLALDVLQETFMYFLKKFPGFTLKCQLKTFLYPAVRNLSIAARHKAERLWSEAGDLDQLPAHADTSGAEDDRLADVLRTLPELHREVLLLRFVDDLSLAEISEALAIPLGTVKSRLHNALELLRKDPCTKQFFEL